MSFYLPCGYGKYIEVELPLVSRMYKLSERFSKNEINNNGHKLAFCDTNIIIDWSQHVKNGEGNKLESIKEWFLVQKIRPVFTLLIAIEFVKGLDSPNHPYANNKKATAQFIDKLNPIWLINHQHLLSLEYLNFSKDKEAHNYLKVFSDRMVDLPKANITNLSFTRSYDCDLGLKNRFNISEATAINEGNFEAQIRKIIDNINTFKQIWHDGVKANVNSTNQVKEAISSSREILYQFIRKGTIQGFITEYILPNALNHQALEELINMPNLTRAPHDFISDVFIRNSYGEGYKDNKSRKGGRDFIDHQHAQIALSYCDYFFTNDFNLREYCKEVINEYNIKCVIGKYEDNQLLIENNVPILKQNNFITT